MDNKYAIFRLVNGSLVQALGFTSDHEWLPDTRFNSIDAAKQAIDTAYDLFGDEFIILPVYCREDKEK